MYSHPPAMAHREPIPSDFDVTRLPTQQNQFHAIEDVNNVVQSLIWNVSQDQRYTGPGCIQEELYRTYPAAYTFLRSIGRNPETIPRLMDHKREIQKVNTQLWAYATTHNVITLRDMEQLVRLELPNTHHLLGPITALPAAREICQTFNFEERVEQCFRNGYQPAELCMTNEEVLQVMYACVCQNRFRMPGTLQHSAHGQAQWWESVFAHHMLVHMGSPSVPPTLGRGSTQTYSLRDLAPFGIRVNGFPALIKSVASMIRPENLTKSNQVAQRCLDEEVRKLYEQFSEEFFTSSALSSLKRSPIKVLRHLAKCASQLHAALKRWAESRGCVWPDGYLDSLLLFGEFVERVANQGPFRSLLHLVLVLSSRGLPDFDRLVTDVTQAAAIGAGKSAIVVDLTDSPSTPIDPDGNEDSAEPYSAFLVDLVKQFNAVLQDQEGCDSETVWQALADLERRFQHQDAELGSSCSTAAATTSSSSSSSSRTLIRWLAEAARKSVPQLNKTFTLRRPDEDGALVESTSTPSQQAQQPSDTGVLQTLPSSSFDPTTVCEFVRKLTWPRERSREDVVLLVSSALHIPRSEQLDQLVGTELSQLNRLDGASREPVLYHEYLKSIDLIGSDVNFTDTPAVDWSMQTSLKLSQRDGVLSFLATCPPMVDLEAWSQWRVPGILLDRWGELDRFLSECGADKVCEQFNLVAVRLLRGADGGLGTAAGGGGGGGLLRLTSSVTQADFDRLFAQWSDSRSLSTARALCDVLIGSLLQVNGLSVSQLNASLGKRLSTQVPGTPNWFDLLMDLQLSCPNSLLGPLFGKVLVPCLDQAGIRPASSWANDSSDVILRHTASEVNTFLDRLWSVAHDLTDGERGILVSAVGSLGLQLQWPAFVRFFERHRVESSAQLHSKDRPDDAGVRPTPSAHTSTFSAGSAQAVEGIQPTQMEVEPTGDELKPTEPDGDACALVPTAMSLASSSTCLTRREFIYELRRREFGCGANLSAEAADLVRRVEGKLARSLVQLSEDLYGAPGHFLLELIQNADDNRYRLEQLDESAGTVFVEDDDVDDAKLPAVEFCAVTHTADQTAGTSVEPKSALLIMNNEAVGFTENDIASLCDIGVSTKVQERDSKTGRKGIGFKSVFNVSDAPEVHSNGFHVRFHRQSRQSTMDQQPTTGGAPPPPSLLIPEWCDSTAPDGSSRWPVPCPVPAWCTTLFVLPLTAKSNAPGLQLSSVIQLTRETIVPSVMLFLRRLRRLTFSCSSGVEQSRVKLLSLTRTTRRLFSSSDASDAIGQTAELISVTEREWDCMQPTNKASATPSTTTVHRWFCFRERLRAEQFPGSGTSPNHTEIAIAISLTDAEPLPRCPIFAYLPVRESGFSFYINADFDLTSSREDVDGTSAWNQWLVGHIPNVFSHMIQQVLQLYQESPPGASDSFQSVTGFSQNQFLGRLLSCMPWQLDPSTQSKSGSVHHTRGGLFYGLPAQLRLRLGKLNWLPTSAATTEVTYAAPNRMLLTPQESNSGESTSTSTQRRPFYELTRLLIDRLGMCEPHPDLLSPNNTLERDQPDQEPDADVKDSALVAADTSRHKQTVTDSNVDLQSYWASGRARREALLWLGVQTTSVDSLLELAANLDADEWRRPGLLSVLLTSLEAAITSHTTGPRANHLPANAISTLRRRVLSALRQLPIFPLTGGNLVRLSDPHMHPLRADLRLPVLLPPPLGSLVNIIDLAYDDYIQLLTKLGPLLDPRTVEFTPTAGSDISKPDLPSLLIQPNPEGLELKLASPETVLTEWILPALDHQQTLPDPVTTDSTVVDWLLAVGQLYASVICLTDCPSYIQLPTKLPILTCDRQGRTHVAPPLGCTLGARRDYPIFLPPTSFTIAPAMPSGSSDELEAKLFEFLLAQLDDADPVQLISVAYFTSPVSTEAHGYRWFQLFSEAGVCTLLSVHSVRYRVTGHQLVSDVGDNRPGDDDQCESSGLPVLPVGHRLRSVLLEALNTTGLPAEAIQLEPTREWIVEDFVSPGLELLLSWIERLASRPDAIETSYQLTALLHDNWSAFERVEQAVYMIKTPVGPGPVSSTDQSRRQSSSALVTARLASYTIGPGRPLGPARWLVQLRQASWLPVLEKRVCDEPRLVSPVRQAPIYSPVAFRDLQKRQDAELYQMLQRACRVWTPGPYITQDPPALAFTKALGMPAELERSAFEFLMKSLATTYEKRDGSSPHSHIRLTPEFMLKIYRTAVRCCGGGGSPAMRSEAVSSDQTDSDAWLRSVFANPDYPCILVRCPMAVTADSRDRVTTKRARADRSPPSTADSRHPNRTKNVCPICIERGLSKQSVATGSKRCSTEPTENTIASDSIHHLTKPDRVCWIRARLPEENHSEQDDGTDSQEDEDEDTLDTHGDQCVLCPQSHRHLARASEPQFRASEQTATTRVFALADCYGSEARSFFVEKLGISFTSSLEEILSLRPDVGRTPARPVRWTKKHWCDFGRRLGQWYALLDHCLLHEAVPRTAASRLPNSTHANHRGLELLQTVRNFPLLFSAEGRWYKPSEVFSVVRSDDEDNAQPDLLAQHRASRVCLFAWTKPSYARLVLHAGQQSTHSGRVLAHSLNLLHARHQSFPAPVSSSGPDPLLLLRADHSSGSAHTEGTAHGLLLDVIGLPVIDRLTMLTLGPMDPRTRATTVPVPVPPKAVPCVPLTSFFETFLRVIALWAPTLPSSSVKVPSTTPSAFLVDHLTPMLEFRDSLPQTASTALKRLHLRSPRCLACVVDDRLYVDSTLGADLFARLASLPADTVAPLIYLAVGLMDDPGLESGSDVLAATAATAEDLHGLFNPLADFICPTGGPDRVALTHFLRGFLNVIRSAVPDLSYTLGFGVSLSAPGTIQQLQNYLTSHGIRRQPAARLLRAVCETRESVRTARAVSPGPTTVQSVTPSNQAPPVSSRHQISSVQSTVDDSALANRTSVTEQSPGSPPARHTASTVSSDDVRPESPGDMSPSRSAMIQSAVNEAEAIEVAQPLAHSVGMSTRSDTILGGLTAQSHFVRLPRDSELSRMASADRIWSSAEPLPPDLSNRLSRMLISSRSDLENPFTSSVGRLGELYVYHRLTELVRRHRERHSNFDQMVGLEFPTGHPILGLGRIVRCHWANADVESRRPFDLDIDVQVECDAAQWDTLLEQIADELSNNVVRIAQRPSFRERDHCKPGLLSVGPIFLEVKATAGRANSDASTTDLFEISMPELMCAAQQGWRYHLLRVVWERDTDGAPLLTTAPQIVHVPDLATELRQQSPALRLCLAMLRVNTTNSSGN